MLLNTPLVEAFALGTRSVDLLALEVGDQTVEESVKVGAVAIVARVNPSRLRYTIGSPDVVW